MNALLFPGQGAQYPGLLAKMSRISGGAQLLARASSILGQNVLTSDDESALAQTSVVQRNTFLASIVTAEALRARGATITAVAGHSVGAFAAAVFAGALTFEDALRLVDLRGRTMDELFSSGFAMGAIVGMDERAVRKLIATFDALFVSAINAVDQITIVGPDATIVEALDAASKRGARTAKLLAVTVPSHSDLMKPVRDALAAAMEHVTLSPPTLFYAANVDGRAKFSGREIASDLIESVAQTVRWSDATGMLLERGVRSFVEPAPGDTLSMLINNSGTQAEATAIDRIGVDEAAYWLHAR